MKLGGILFPDNRIERKGRALHYHAFAVTPLVVLAELAASRGEDWYQFNNGAVHRLAALTIAGLAKPELFEKLTDTEQDNATRPGAGWYQLYRARFPERLKSQHLTSGPPQPPDHRWLGGDVGVLREVLAHAEAGQFNERSWAYWHYRLGLARVNQVPAMPVRTFA